MPTINRALTVQAEPEEVWGLVSDPYRLPLWWPGVQRVEEASADAWTKVLVTPKGKTVRADYTRVEAQRPRRLVWRQEIEESPFERILADSFVEIALEPSDGATRVALTIRQHTRGFARFGFVQLRRAAARQLEGALQGLAEAVEGQGG